MTLIVYNNVVELVELRTRPLSYEMQFSPADILTYAEKKHDSIVMLSTTAKVWFYWFHEPFLHIEPTS